MHCVGAMPFVGSSFLLDSRTNSCAALHFAISQRRIQLPVVRGMVATYARYPTSSTVQFVCKVGVYGSVRGL
jgi:hypothetical protein